MTNAELASRSQELPSSRTSPLIERVLGPFERFAAQEIAGGLVLLACTVIALVWANSPWRHSYESLWTTQLSVRLGGGEVANDLRGWVNDGLMTLFFLVVGLEAKRELDVGDLRDRSRVLLPIFAAIGNAA